MVGVIFSVDILQKEYFADRSFPVHDRWCPMFKTLNKIGFFKIILDDAAFRQVLCTSSAHMTMLRGGAENAEAIALSNKAIQSLNKRIGDPVLAVSDGVMVTILAFACHAVIYPYPSILQVNM